METKKLKKKAKESCISPHKMFLWKAGNWKETPYTIFPPYRCNTSCQANARCNKLSDFLLLIFAGCDTQVDLLIIVDSSESVIENDPYGKPLYNWKKTKVCTLILSRGLSQLR